MATNKAVYIRGSKGTKGTPLAIPDKPLPAFVNTVDLTLFKGGMGSKKPKGK